MTIFSALMTRRMLSPLSTVAFLVAGATAAVAVTDPCYVGNGMTFCCLTTLTDCTDAELDVWTCTSSASAGPFALHRVRKAVAGYPGWKDLQTTNSSCVWTKRICGEQPNTCITVSVTTITCQSNIAIGDDCVGPAEE